MDETGPFEEWDERYRGQAQMWSGRPNDVLVAEIPGRTAGRALDVGYPSRTTPSSGPGAASCPPVADRRDGPARRRSRPFASTSGSRPDTLGR